MMKYLSAFLMAISGMFFYLSAQSINGVVLDESGNPLPGANVVIKDSYKGTTTDLSGTFTFPGLKTGKYVLQVSYMGYETKTEKIDLTAEYQASISLERKPILSEEVMITSTTAKSNTPVAFSNLRKEEIEENYAVQDIPYLLSQTPSVVVSSDAGTGIGYTSLRIRGTNANRINVTINGIPWNDAESHNLYWVDLPDLAEALENIQVQRGVGTSTNGAGAFGGTINLQTLSLNEESYAAIKGSFGSFNTYKGNVKFGTGLVKDKYAFDGSVSTIQSDGYIDRAFSDLNSFYLSGGIFGKNNILRMSILRGFEETYQAWGGVPKAALDTNRTYNPYTYENEVDHYDQIHYQLHYSHQFNSEWLLNTALHYTKGYGYYEQYQDDDNYYHQTSFAHYGLENIAIGGDTITQTDLIRRLWLDNDFYGFTWSLNRNSQKSNFILGGGYNQYAGDHYGKIIWARFAGNSEINHEWYNNVGNKNDFNIFAKLNYQLADPINLFADMQYRWIDFKTSGNENGLNNIGLQREFHFLNPKVGVFYQLNTNQQVYASFSVAHREPNRENYVDAIYLGYESPKPEILYDYEGGYELKALNYFFGANLYYMDYADQLISTGEINYIGLPVLRNVPESYRMGIELQAAWQPVQALNMELNTTLSRNKIRNFVEKIELYNDVNTWTYLGHQTNELGERDLSFSPSFIINGVIRYKPFKGMNISLNPRHVSRQFIDNTSNKDRSLDPYTVVDLSASYAIASTNLPEISLSFKVFNVLNEQYETNAWVYRATFNDKSEYTDYGYFPQAHTHFLFTVAMDF